MKRDTDLVALTSGLLFLAVAGLWLAARLTDLDWLAVAWIVAVGLVVLGVAGIARALAATGRRHAGDPDR